MALFSPGDHIVAPADLYGGTFRLFDKFLKEKGNLVYVRRHDRSGKGCPRHLHRRREESGLKRPAILC